MRWTLTVPTLTLVVLAATLTPVWPEEPELADDATAAKDDGEVEIRLSELKRPEDFAPAERIVSGRDTTDFRREGTFLAKASREIPKVDEESLVARKYAMYEGRRFYRSPTPSAEEMNRPRAVAVRRKLAAAAAIGPAGSFGWMGWTLLAVAAAAVLVAWRRGWFVPFSVRAEEQKRALRVASGKHRRREKKRPRIELVRRR